MTKPTKPCRALTLHAKMPPLPNVVLAANTVRPEPGPKLHPPPLSLAPIRPLA